MQHPTSNLLTFYKLFVNVLGLCSSHFPNPIMIRRLSAACDLLSILEDFVPIQLIKRIVPLCVHRCREPSLQSHCCGEEDWLLDLGRGDSTDSTNVSNSLRRRGGDKPRSPSRDAACRRLSERARVRAVLNHAKLRDCHPAHPLGMHPIHQPQTAVQQHCCRR